MDKDQVVLDVKKLNIAFRTNKKKIEAVSDMSFQLHKGEILGIVGESGSGKSITSLSILGLLPTPPGVIENSEVLFQGKDLTKTSEKEMRKIRGNHISMIFQEPMTSLNPLFTIGDQLREALELHRKLPKKEADSICIKILQNAGLARAEAIMSEYPHQLSGGMRQRVMIAMAMICEPEILIADEPTTALDVTIQSQILGLMKELSRTTETSIIFITHDLGVVAEMCDRVIVMYCGKIVEEGDIQTIFKKPKHPYTQGLLKSVPDIRYKDERLYSIPGNVPKPGTIKQGCHFASRCEYVMERCTADSPKLLKSSTPDHSVRCFKFEEERMADAHD